jgi:hypothetical protein
MNFQLNNRKLIYENEKFYILTIKPNLGYKEGEYRELKIRKKSNGYNSITINHKEYMIHRILAYLFLGLDIENSTQFIDHINGIRDDNRLENLRIVTHQQNCFNILNTKGYTKIGNKYQARIMTNRKTIYLGYYDTEEEAKQTYLDAKKKYHIIPPFNKLKL